MQTKEYLQILHLASQETESVVDNALRNLFDQDGDFTSKSVESIIKSDKVIESVRDVVIDNVNLASYDELLNEMEASYG